MCPGIAACGLTWAFVQRQWLDVAWRVPAPAVVGYLFGYADIS